MLKNIVAHKWKELREQKKRKPLNVLLEEIERRPQPRNFQNALKEKSSQVGIIAEIKKAAPGYRHVNLVASDPVSCAVGSLARAYEKAGSAAISVLTEERYFAGGLADLVEVKNCTSIPVLRKDFLIDEYQIYESRASGADAVLLISSLLTSVELACFISLARELGMAALVETGKAAEVEKAVQAGAEIIGINNRNLHTLEVSLERTILWGPFVPRNLLLVSESGIFHRKQVEHLKNEAGIDAILVGRSLMNSPSPEDKLRELMGNHVSCTG